MAVRAFAGRGGQLERLDGMLARRLGGDRVAAEPFVVEQIIARCDGLPLALAIAAGRASTEPALALPDLAGELSRTPSRLDALHGTGRREPHGYAGLESAAVAGGAVPNRRRIGRSRDAPIMECVQPRPVSR